MTNLTFDQLTVDSHISELRAFARSLELKANGSKVAVYNRIAAHLASLEPAAEPAIDLGFDAHYDELGSSCPLAEGEVWAWEAETELADHEPIEATEAPAAVRKTRGTIDVPALITFLSQPRTAKQVAAQFGWTGWTPRRSVLNKHGYSIQEVGQEGRAKLFVAQPVAQ